MVKLVTNTEPYWLPLGLDLKFLVRPYTTAIWATANARVRRTLKATRDARKLIEDSGGVVGDLPDLADLAVLEGESETELTRLLAEAVVLEWEGVFFDGTDEPVPLSRENVRLLMDMPGVAESFMIAYLSGQREAALEKKDSGLAPNGTSRRGAGPDTAPTATPKASRARKAKKGSRASGAPTSKTSP